MEQQPQNPGFNSLATAQQFHELPLTVSSMQYINDELLPETMGPEGSGMDITIEEEWEPKLPA